MMQLRLTSRYFDGFFNPLIRTLTVDGKQYVEFTQQLRELHRAVIERRKLRGVQQLSLYNIGYETCGSVPQAPSLEMTEIPWLLWLRDIIQHIPLHTMSLTISGSVWNACCKSSGLMESQLLVLPSTVRRFKLCGSWHDRLDAEMLDGLRLNDGLETLEIAYINLATTNLWQRMLPRSIRAVQVGHCAFYDREILGHCSDLQSFRANWFKDEDYELVPPRLPALLARHKTTLISISLTWDRHDYSMWHTRQRVEHARPNFRDYLALKRLEISLPFVRDNTGGVDDIVRRLPQQLQVLVLQNCDEAAAHDWSLSLAVRQIVYLADHYHGQLILVGIDHPCVDFLGCLYDRIKRATKRVSVMQVVHFPASLAATKCAAHLLTEEPCTKQCLDRSMADEYMSVYVADRQRSTRQSAIHEQWMKEHPNFGYPDLSEEAYTWLGYAQPSAFRDQLRAFCIAEGIVARSS